MHREQIKIINDFGKKSNKEKITGMMQNILIKSSKHPKLAAAQGALTGFFPTMSASFAVSMFLGPQLFPLIYAIGKCLEYSPTITILLLEIKKE